jgi:hypothetical protein
MHPLSFSFLALDLLAPQVYYPAYLKTLYPLSHPILEPLLGDSQSSYLINPQYNFSLLMH